MAASIEHKENLRGYSLPLTPGGTSSLIPPPPWHFSGQVIWVDYRADPRAAARFLPTEVRLSAAEFNAAVGFYDWQWCGDAGAELRDPETAQFRECMISLDAWLGEERVCRVPLAWVDATVPLVRGWLQGMPKIPGSVAMSRSVGIGRATSRVARDGHFYATVAASGKRLIGASVRLVEPAPPPRLALQPLIHTRHDPGWGVDIPARTDLVRSTVSDCATGQVWSGAAELHFDAALGELLALAPVAVGRGSVFSYAETLRPGGPAKSTTGDQRG